MAFIELVVPTAFLAVLAAVARLRLGSWVAPGAFFSLVWLGQVILSFVIPDYPVWPGTLWWIALSCFVFLLGALLGKAAVLSPEPMDRSRDLPALRRPVITLVACALLGGAYTVIVRVLNIDIQMDRPPLPYQCLLSFQYSGPALAGLLVGTGTLRGRRAFASLLTLAPAATLALLYTGRTALVEPILLWIGGYIATKTALTRGTFRLFTPRHMVTATVILVLFLWIGMGLQQVRATLDIDRDTRLDHIADLYASEANSESIWNGWHKFRSAIFGNVYSFSYFFEQAWNDPPRPEYGKVIFAAPLELLGLDGMRVPWGSFPIDYGVESNIYTMFRPPIADFGLWGSLLWWFGLGLLQGWAYERARQRFIGPAWLLIWFYADVIIIGGYFFRYNTIILCHGIVALYLLLGQARQRVRRLSSSCSSQPASTLATEPAPASEVCALERKHVVESLRA
jgi:oligosaccharide repeat unit polymerase